MLCREFRRAAEVVGRRWVVEILWSLHEQPLRFMQIRRRIPGLSDRLLSQRLQELEREGLVERRVDTSSRPVRVAYTLTRWGRGLEAVLRDLHDWAHEWA
ncbi:MAG: helix-turn-helix transcriptional regulator [Clostridia bacterium]|nr:helix-turn-helix transcriptional regulator [Clostridia bacterium]MCL6522359.1 helix-turn-helix transcriptional regulator [Bacillota bacterium]